MFVMSDRESSPNVESVWAIDIP